MGSDAHFIVVGGAPSLLAAAEARIGQLEQRWSRFLPDSEINLVNRWAGFPVAVSEDTRTLIEHGLVAWRLSGGAFDPTVLGAVVRAGYDRSFELMANSPGGSSGTPGAGAAAGNGGAANGHRHLGPGVEGIVVGRETVTLPPGVGFDPGGIGKGLAADLIAAEVMAAGADGVCINLGGDVRVAGRGPDGDSWTVAVEHPWSTDPVLLIGLTGGAVATSTTLRRQWQIDGRRRHHLIDPQTGEPSDSDVNLSTVVAGDAWVAEVLAKAVLLAGSAHPFDILGGTGAHGLAVDDRGDIHSTPGLADFLGGAALPSALEAVNA